MKPELNQEFFGQVSDNAYDMLVNGRNSDGTPAPYRSFVVAPGASEFKARVALATAVEQAMKYAMVSVLEENVAALMDGREEMLKMAEAFGPRDGSRYVAVADTLAKVVGTMLEQVKQIGFEYTSKKGESHGR